MLLRIKQSILQIYRRRRIFETIRKKETADVVAPAAGKG
jgi:hypothetical protein